MVWLSSWATTARELADSGYRRICKVQRRRYFKRVCTFLISEKYSSIRSDPPALSIAAERSDCVDLFASRTTPSGRLF